LKRWVKQIQHQLDADPTTWKGKEGDSSCSPCFNSTYQSGADHRESIGRRYHTVPVTQFSPEIRQRFRWIILSNAHSSNGLACAHVSTQIGIDILLIRAHKKPDGRKLGRRAESGNYVIGE